MAEFKGRNLYLVVFTIILYIIYYLVEPQPLDYCLLEIYDNVI